MQSYCTKLPFLILRLLRTSFSNLSSHNLSNCTMASPFENCTHITADCPSSATTFGYKPNLAVNTILLAIFAVCAIAQLYLGLRHRVRGYSIATTAGCLLEVIGYGGPVLMHDNPWSSSGFKIQVIYLIVAPSFLAAGIYLTFKHLVLLLGREKSRIPPRAYPWTFVSCDILSIVLQAAGGGIAASSTSNLVNVGNHVMISGIAFQVATMFVCICLAADCAWTWQKLRQQHSNDVKEDVPEPGPKHLSLICIAIALSFLLIFVRCVYRCVLDVMSPTVTALLIQAVFQNCQVGGEATCSVKSQSSSYLTERKFNQRHSTYDRCSLTMR